MPLFAHFNNLSSASKRRLFMPHRTLYEALTGYEPPAADTTDGPQLLGMAAGGGPSDGETTEQQFPDILDSLQAHAATDPLFEKKLADAFGIDPTVVHEQLQEARRIVAQSRESSLLLGAGVSDFQAQEEALLGPELLGVPADF